MNLKDEIIVLLKKAQYEDSYQNPYFVQQVIGALAEVWGDTDDALEKWANELWSA
jgi:hypothetical protein